LPVEHADLVGGGEDVGQQHGVLVGDRAGQCVHGQVGVGDADVFGLRAVDQMAEDPASPAAALTVHGLAAEAAAAAGGDAGHEHAVSGTYAAHVAAGLDDLADRLVSEDGARLHLGHVALEDVQIRAADGDGVDPHDRVGGFLDAGIGDFFPGGLPGAVEDVALHAVPHPSCSRRATASGAAAPACGGGPGEGVLRP